MTVKKDSLGRRIPDFDRSKAGKKAYKTRKEKYGTAHISRSAALGGSNRTRGYFGKLKDEGKTEELKQLSKKGHDSRWEEKHSGESGDTLRGGQ